MTGALVAEALQQELFDRRFEQFLREQPYSELIDQMLKQRWMWKQYLKFQQVMGNRAGRKS